MGIFLKTIGISLFVVFLLAVAGTASADPPETSDLAQQLRLIDTRVSTTSDGESPREMVARDIRARRQAANRQSSHDWRAISNRDECEKFRKPRLEALRRSLGTLPTLGADLKTRVTARLAGDGYRIENLVYESRPGLWVTANRYLPPATGKSIPGVLLCHSHHNPKTEGELQDMGATWARAGCAVLVMDQLGHGERRQHPFRTSADYTGRFPVGRQDYFFRHNVALQLHLAGESLIGWMAGDLMRGVDLLLARTDVDRTRIILMGAVAGGGDPAAVTAALDERIAAVVPFNFGGPQPETRYPLPDDAEETFNYAGGGSWESTRNLRLSIRDGFLPWVIVAGLAPRRLVYAHEFSWDQPRDPVWKRLEQVYRWHDAPQNLSFTHGRGLLSGRPPDATHCNNIGLVHRQRIHAALADWFGIATSPDNEFSARRSADQLRCMTETVAAELRPKPAREVAAELASSRLAAARSHRATLAPADRRRKLREQLAALLGDIDIPKDAASTAQRIGEPVALGKIRCERVSLRVEPRIHVPLVVFTPDNRDKRLPVVVAISQAGKQRWLHQRSDAVAQILESGVAVCCADLRATGETSTGDGRDRTSQATALAADYLMLGQTLIGSQVRDLRTVLAYLRTRSDIDPRRIALWGDSLAAPNPEGANLAIPHGADRSAAQSEPTAATAVLLAALFEDQIAAVNAAGGLYAFQSVLDSPFCYLPADVIVPGLLTAADLRDIVTELAPLPVRLERLVDGQNRPVAAKNLQEAFAPAKEAYRGTNVAALVISPDDASPTNAAQWLISQLRQRP